LRRPSTITETVLNSRWVARAGLRRAVLVAFALVLAVLSIWPRPYEASTLMAPDDSAAGLTGLFSAGGGVNLISSLLGGRGTVDADLLVGRSNAVFHVVAQKLQEQGRYRDMSIERLEARLRRKVEVESLRGSILQISIQNHDAGLALQIINDFADALQQRLTTLSRDQANAKKEIVGKRMEDATRQYDQAQQALNAYRAAHHFSTPEVQQAFSQGAQVQLQGQLQAAQTMLSTLERTRGNDNMELQTVRDRIQVLEGQISAIETQTGAGSIQSLAKVNPEVAEYRDLEREEGFAQARYDIYKRYLESLTVQEVAAPLSVAVIDPPFIDPERHFNLLPLGFLALLVVVAAFAEFYLGSQPAFAATHRRAPTEGDEPSEPDAASDH
jgi:uncharacterized protein involved in exopolysaccharide biosynthesis